MDRDEHESATPQAPSADLWKAWLDASTDALRQIATAGVANPLEMTTNLVQTLAQAQVRTPAGDPLPLDPARFLRDWYDATSQTLSTLSAGVMGQRGVSEAAGRFLDAYCDYYKALRQAYETQLHSLELPTRSDVARAAGLVVAIEDKVDRLADAMDALRDGPAQVASAAAVGALEERIVRLEEKLDAVLNIVAIREVPKRTESDPERTGRPAQRGAPPPRARRTSRAADGQAPE